MRKTITTQNRFTTFIQNWLGKLPASLLFLCLIFLFFSCKDDASSIGLKKDPRLKASYVDIPLHPSVVSLPSVLTQNVSTDRFARTLIGKYNDPRLGNITATTYLNFSTPLSAVKPGNGAVADSLVMELAVDFYQYGGTTPRVQTFELYELLDTMNASGYYSNSTVPYKSTPIATASVLVDPDEFANALLLNSDADTTNDERLKIKIRIPGSLGADVLAELVNSTSAVSDFSVFSGKYKGFALVPKDCNMIFGIDPTITYPYVNSQSRMALYFTEDGVQSRADLAMFPATNAVTGFPNNVISFTSFSIDRSGTALAGIQPYSTFVPGNGYFYTQAGTSLVTKLDLRDFYNYLDTLDNVIFNSAEIITNNTITTGAISNVRVRVLDSLNRFRTPYVDSLVYDVLTTTNIPIFNSAVVPSLYNVMNFGAPQSSPTIDLILSGGLQDGSTTPLTTDSYQISGLVVTEFCQSSLIFKKNVNRVKWLAIIPEEVEFRKTVNSLIFDSNISLRLYYSRPIIKIR